jgi:FLVCR family MFS transporter 7
MFPARHPDDCNPDTTMSDVTTLYLHDSTLLLVPHRQSSPTDVSRTITSSRHRYGEPREATHHDATVYVLYTQRWSVLASFGVLSMSSAWLWITWSPIAPLVADMWDVPLGQVDQLSGIYLYVYVLGSIVALYLVVNYIGLYRGLLIGGVCNATGAYLRYAYMHDYTTVYWATLLCAVAQTFTLATPPSIAGTWFGDTERATATALGVLANQFGTALGLGATIVIPFELVTHQGNVAIDTVVLKKYLWLQVGVAVLALLLVALLGADAPPTPPSKSASLSRRCNNVVATKNIRLQENSNVVNDTAPLVEATEVDDHKGAPIGLSYGASVRSLFANRNRIACTISFGMAVGVFYTIPTFLGQLLPRSWSRKAVGWLGFSYQAAGAVGSFGSGRLVDWTQQPQLISLAFLTTAAFCIILLTAVMSQTAPAWPISVAFTVGVVGSGFSLAAWNTVGLELGSSLTFPADEAVVAGILESGAELFGFLWVTIGGYSIEVAPTMFLMLLGSAVVAALILLGSARMETARPQ